MLTTLITKIKNVLMANTLIQEVYEFEPDEFKGSPVAVVVPSANESDYNTTGENVRIYAFTLRLYVSRTAIDKQDVGQGHQNADLALRGLVDSVLDDFDKDYSFVGLVVPTGYTFINTFAMPSSWGYYGGEDEYRVATVEIKCRVAVDLTQIT